MQDSIDHGTTGTAQECGWLQRSSKQRMPDTLSHGELDLLAIFRDEGIFVFCKPSNDIFSSYDEPGLRATFVVSVQHHNSYNAISNMPVYARLPVDDDFVITGFERTPPVQTYLIAFIISDFDFIEELDDEGIPHRIYSTPEDIADGFGDLALNVSRSLLDGFQEYLGINYSLPKMDQAAIPDFAAGAMENWGLVTYAEPYLLFSENASTTRDREYVITTISHEFVVSDCLSRIIVIHRCCFLLPPVLLILAPMVRKSCQPRLVELPMDERRFRNTLRVLLDGHGVPWRKVGRPDAD